MVLRQVVLQGGQDLVHRSSLPIACPQGFKQDGNRQPNFQQAMEITAAWLQQWENEEISDEVLADRVGEMVASRDGARGFFVVSLAGDSALMDRLPDAVVGQLCHAGNRCRT